MKARRRRRHASILDRYAYNVLASVGLGLLATVLGTCVAAWLLTLVDVPIWAIYALDYANLWLGSYASGYHCAARRQRRGILSGLLCGLGVACSVLLLAGALSVGSSAHARLCKVLVASVGGAVGGVRSANRHSV